MPEELWDPRSSTRELRAMFGRLCILKACLCLSGQAVTFTSSHLLTTSPIFLLFTRPFCLFFSPIPSLPLLLWANSVSWSTQCQLCARFGDTIKLLRIRFVNYSHSARPFLVMGSRVVHVLEGHSGGHALGLSLKDWGCGWRKSGEKDLLVAGTTCIKTGRQLCGPETVGTMCPWRRR